MSAKPCVFPLTAIIEMIRPVTFDRSVISTFFRFNRYPPECKNLE